MIAKYYITLNDETYGVLNDNDIKNVIVFNIKNNKIRLIDYSYYHSIDIFVIDKNKKQVKG